MGPKMGWELCLFLNFTLFYLSDQCIVGHVAIHKAWQQEMIQVKENDSCCACCAGDNAGD